MLPDIRKQDGETGRGEELNILAKGSLEEGGVAVGLRGEMTMVRDMRTVSPPGHGGNERGRHDELCYCSSAPKASATLGGSVYD